MLYVFGLVASVMIINVIFLSPERMYHIRTLFAHFKIRCNVHQIESQAVKLNYLIQMDHAHNRY